MLFDGLFALALEEVRENSVSAIRAHAFNNGEPLRIDVFETGEEWQYVWTRDIAYAVDLALASLDPMRCARSLMYKTSGLKESVGQGGEQILQDTGSGGSYPVSTDRIVWALAAARLVHHLSTLEQQEWIARTLPILCNTIEQDRRLVFNTSTGLYRGEQSFLDWREQTYPHRTKDNVLPIAMSECVSTNVTHYLILAAAADGCDRQGDSPTAQKYAAWASDLKDAINTQLFDEEAGLYAGYLLTDVTAAVRVHRYDLLGQALAILSGIADEARAHRILNSYPTGPFGPPVVWPQEPTVPIYHNHAIWPFVTAYWIKAARKVGHASAAAAGIASLVRGVAAHQSNMENLDFASGDIHAHAFGLSGPVMNSRRQLWSVAGYVSMVQDVIFGMETSADGIRFHPYMPAATRERFFADKREIHLRQVIYRGKRIDITLYLPETHSTRSLSFQSAKVNDRLIDDGFVRFDALQATNVWHVYLAESRDEHAESLRTIEDFSNPRTHFGPPEPQWRPIGQDGLAAVEGRIKLHYEPAGDRDVVYNIYRDGQCVARHVKALEWIDPDSADYTIRVRQYAIESVYPETGNHSHVSATRMFVPIRPEEKTTKQRRQRCDRKPIRISFRVPQAGRYVLRLIYANGNGAINTGLTCAIKRLSVRDARGDELITAYAVFPQTGGGNIFQPSSPLTVALSASGDYTMRIDEDEICRNMSYFKHNETYTGHEGGGPLPVNVIRVDSVAALWLSP